MRLLRNEWFWLVVVVTVFVLIVLAWTAEPCRSGFYWEQGIGCTRD